MPKAFLRSLASGRGSFVKTASVVGCEVAVDCRLVVYGMIGSVQINFMVGVVAFLQQFLGRAIDTIIGQ